jgi:hypothetical protein
MPAFAVTQKYVYWRFVAVIVLRLTHGCLYLPLLLLVLLLRRLAW